MDYLKDRYLFQGAGGHMPEERLPSQPRQWIEADYTQFYPA